MELFRMLLLLFITTIVTAQRFPYIPTRLLQSPQHEGLLYIFQPSSANGKFQLDTINTGSTLITDNISSKTVSSTLPFAGSDGTIPFEVVMEYGGNITVYAGNCTSDSASAQVWTFITDLKSSNGDGEWKQIPIGNNSLQSGGSEMAPKYLSSGISFSTKEGGSVPGAYFFGGMCPSGGATQATWQSSANYSNSMIVLSPSSGKPGGSDYGIETASSRGAPIAEAGFSMTPLLPTYSNALDGSQSKQQNFVLIGGHTALAFINMSQVALFSLPQESWTFIPVEQPTLDHADLAIRTDVDEIEPRSGHAAVLSEDGNSIIVFGGWIGDVNTPAEPQLAVLNVGEEYGGSGTWKWKAPSPLGQGLSSGTGIYGHGAIMLPGGVMMVTGGYSISGQSSRRKFRARQEPSSKTMFYNITSNSWLKEYTAPPTATGSQGGSGGGGSGPLSTIGQKAGLGVGVGIGCAAVVGIVLLYIWNKRRRQRNRQQREKDLRDLSLAAHRFPSELFGGGGIDGRGGDMTAIDYVSTHPQGPNNGYGYSRVGSEEFSRQGWRNARAQEAERTGLLVEIPSPTRGLRRNLQSRGHHYHAAPRYDEKRVAHGSAGHIHPIDEREEDEQADADNNNEKSVPLDDPFFELDRPRNGRASVSPEPITSRNGLSSPAEERAQEFQLWTSDWQRAADNLLNPTGGRISPTKSDRTHSSLSDKSTRSNLSYKSNGSGPGPSRNLSIRTSVAIGSVPLNANPFATPDGSPSSGRNSPSRNSLHQCSNSREDGDSFKTAKSSFAQLQAEGETLLGTSARPDSITIPSPYRSESPNLPTAASTTVFGSEIDGDGGAGVDTTASHERDGEKRKSWIGSVRRALVRATSSTDRPHSIAADTPSFRVLGPNDPRVSKNSGQTSSLGSHPARASSASPTGPRRAASDASFWKAKRGPKDWTDEETAAAAAGIVVDEASTPGAAKTHLGIPGKEPGGGSEMGDSEFGDDSDWDVEAAVERRVVQVMFTVPKQRLRVVNADAESRSLVSLEPEPRRSQTNTETDQEESSTVVASSSSAGPSAVKRYQQSEGDEKNVR